MSILCDSAYVSLGVAIIEQAERDYYLSGEKLLTKKYSKRWMYENDVATFMGCRAFFLQGCNGIAPHSGRQVLETINKRNSVDEAAVLERIKRGFDGE